MGAFVPGMRLGERFDVVARLGAGGIAEVFHARDAVSGQDVALKALHDHLAHDRALSERFRREMALTRGLDHPSIVRVFDLHQHDGRPFISMELLHGSTLSARLQQGPLPEAEARRIARSVCEALREAHRAGVVHRDLKPQNVFLGDDGSVKLLDFGLARVAGQARLTAQSMVMGTPGYIAPELLGGAPADARADVYSLGATLFEMLTGRHAFPGSDPYEVLRLQREGAPRMPGVEPAVEALVRRMLEPDPERRFLDAEQVLRALGGELVPAAPEPMPGLRAGKLDLVVHHAGVGQGGRLAALVSRLGGKLTRGWRARLAIDGRNRLVAGASKETAEAIGALLAEQGFATAVVPTGRRWRLMEWLGRHCWRTGAAAALTVNGWLLYRIVESRLWQPPMPPWMVLAVTGFFSAIFTAISFFPIAGLFSLAAAPPLRDLPGGDPALMRLAQGIGRRVRRLRDRHAQLPAAQRILLEDVLHEAGQTESVAMSLAARAPADGDDPEGVTLPHGMSRDRIAARLLEIAAALDDALAAAEPGSASPASALSRLRAEVEFARKALPDAME